MNMSRNSLTVTSLGNPKDPKTWSGTPSNIIKALENLGVTVFGIDSSIKNKYQSFAYLTLHKILGLGAYDYNRGRFARTYRAKIVQNQSNTYSYQKILHTGTLDLPLAKIQPRGERYLFCDSTWNLWSQNVTDISSYTPKMLQLAEKLEQESYAQIKHFFPISKYVQNNLINHYQIDPKQITVVGTGRGNIEPFTEEKDYKNGHILFVAKERFIDKGGLLLLEGFKIAQKNNPSLKLIIVAPNEYRSLVSSIPNATVTGYIYWQELQNLFNTATLFAMPALNEPWGLVYLEALACKVPILGLNRNSLPEITGNGQYGFLVEEPTPDKIADAILQAYSNLDALSSMGKAGQNYCLETFSWEQVANKIANVMLEKSY